MSHTEHHIGRIKELVSDLPLEEQMQDLITAQGKFEKPSYCDTLLDWFRDVFEAKNKYFVYKDKIYEVFDKELEDDADIIEAEHVSATEISYQLKFYNGGAGFYECLEEALDKLPEFPNHKLI